MTSSFEPRPMRGDARRNRELLLAAARELFAERGVDVAMADIARHAGVSNGTLYNHFSARSDLVEAVFIDRLAAMVELTDRALAVSDSWQGFVDCLTGVCELQAADRGFNEVAARGMGTSPVTQGLRETVRRKMGEVFARAQRSGDLRDDVTVDDLLFVVGGISRTVELTADIAPRLWRRHLALLLDGFRAAGAHPLPEPPIDHGRVHGGSSIS